MQLGIRLHDVNDSLPPERQTLEARTETARAEGFSCVHLALSKVISGTVFDDCALTEGLAMYVKRVCARNELDVAVLGCYQNLAHPDPEALRAIQSLYYGHLRAAAYMGAGVVGTETGAPNPDYATDANTYTEEALETFIRNLAPVVERAEHWGVTVAIEPVCRHIVCDADRALRVLRAIASPNLRIILDPVNLLHTAGERDRIIADAIDKLGEHVAVIHLKDFVTEKDGLRETAPGLGEMDYTRILRFIKERKPYIQATLECTSNENAVSAREMLERAYAAL